jgi:hypothetical protein
MSVDAEEETAGTTDEDATTDEGAIRGRDAGPLTDTSREEAAEVIHARTNEGREDVSVASNEATSRPTALKEVAAETLETDTMTDEEIMEETAADLVVAMAVETLCVIEMAVET